RHRRAGIGRRMLDVWPVDVSPSEIEVDFDRLPRVVWIANDEATDNVHAVAVQMVDGLDARVPDDAASFAAHILRAGAKKGEIVVDHVLDAEKDVSKAGVLHQRREPCAVLGD